jgi:hypothetical protein
MSKCPLDHQMRDLADGSSRCYSNTHRWSPESEVAEFLAGESAFSPDNISKSISISFVTFSLALLAVILVYSL